MFEKMLEVFVWFLLVALRVARLVSYAYLAGATLVMVVMIPLMRLDTGEAFLSDRNVVNLKAYLVGVVVAVVLLWMYRIIDNKVCLDDLSESLVSTAPRNPHFPRLWCLYCLLPSYRRRFSIDYRAGEIRRIN